MVAVIPTQPVIVSEILAAAAFHDRYVGEQSPVEAILIGGKQKVSTQLANRSLAVLKVCPEAGVL